MYDVGVGKPLLLFDIASPFARLERVTVAASLRMVLLVSLALLLLPPMLVVVVDAVAPVAGSTTDDPPEGMIFISNVRISLVICRRLRRRQKRR